MDKDLIPEFKRDDSLDYLKILKAIKEIRFGVGKNLLIDFLTGDMSNKSIIKNNLNELENFNSLKNSEKVREMIENLINNGRIQLVSSDFNKFCKVLELTEKGKKEIYNPKLNDLKLKNKFIHKKTEISEGDKILFNELGSFLGDYNNEQKKAIISDNGNILCVAGAGSGKTTVLTKRIEFLVKYKGINSQRILAITFTRKARQEMQSRLLKLGINNVQVETFNSFSEKILQKYGHKIYGRGMRVLNYQDKIMALMGALNNQGLEINQAIERYFTPNQKRSKTTDQLNNIFMNDCFFVIDYFKSKNKELYDFSKNGEGEDIHSGKIVYGVAKYLNEFMETAGLRDYTDQVLDTIKFFKDNNELIPKFEHILVDEYQDVNSMQIELLRLLNGGKLFCVGDPRQSIFGWRGSDINYILEFEKKYPKCEIISLTKNYRSNNHIVSFMNKSIKDMELPDLEHNFESKKEIFLKEFGSEQEEFGFVVNQILNSDIEGGEIFVLARTNRQLNEISNLMRQKGIRHVVKSDELRRPVIGEKGDVTVATIHAIKGLEAKMVFIIGCNEQNFPCKASDHPVIEMIKMEEYDKEEEEKRLFYVAISRAKEKLYLSYATKKPTYFINGEMLDMIDEKPVLNKQINKKLQAWKEKKEESGWRENKKHGGNNRWGGKSETWIENDLDEENRHKENSGYSKKDSWDGMIGEE